tara:strand:+ start:258 stop:500 length:243 start_codon:yes stop_codon:yes gene_type:complete
MISLNFTFKTNFCRRRANPRPWSKKTAKNYGRKTAKSPLNREHPDQLFLRVAHLHAQNQQVQRKEEEEEHEETEEYPEER